MQLLDKQLLPHQAIQLCITASELCNIKLKSNKGLHSYFGQANQLATELNNNKGYKIGPTIITQLILQGLLSCYKMVHTVISYRKDVSDTHKFQATLHTHKAELKVESKLKAAYYVKDKQQSSNQDRLRFNKARPVFRAKPQQWKQAVQEPLQPDSKASGNATPSMCKPRCSFCSY
jgi:hypothetical protein